MCRRVLVCCWAAVMLSLGGCLARQVAHDGKCFRQALLDMYTDQIMDNLVRARCNLPFVQVAYSDLVVQDTDSLGSEGDLTQTIAEGRVLAAAEGVTATLSRSLENVYAAKGTAAREMQMSFKAQPITDQNDVYEAYLAFAHNESLFVVSDAPPRCAVHIQRKCGGKWYWVPAEAGNAFLDLALRTTFMRGAEAIPPAAYERQIVSVGELKKVGEGDAISANIYFNESVPNGVASTIVTLDDGRKVRLNLRPVSRTPDDKPLKEGEQTIRLRAQWGPKAEGFTEVNLIGRPARVYSADYPPAAPIPRPSLQPVVNELERIRLNQARSRL